MFETGSPNPGHDCEVLNLPRPCGAKDQRSGRIRTLETQTEWFVHGFSFANYLQELGPDAQKAVYSKLSVDLALRDAFHKMRHFLMTTIV